MENSRNIVLTGMPGAGKTYIGAKLAKLLAHFNYVDIDEEIEKSEKMSISEIFEKYSENYFRTLETKFITEFAAKSNHIISVGGGAFKDESNIFKLKQNGLVFYLKASPEEIFSRIKNQTHRPLLQNDLSMQKLKSVLKKREKNYKKAHFCVDTNKKQAYTILDEILCECEKYGK